MNNYNKIGYSVQEVAQIFGCTPSTVRKYIYDGHLKADMIFVNKRNNIRIRREQLIEYMREHKSRFDSKTLASFGIMDDKEDKKTPQKKSPEFAPGAYVAKDVSELEGAWGKQGDKQKSDTNIKVRYSDHGAASVQLRNSRTEDKRFPTYDIYADDKIVISGCEKLTVGKIVDALVTDRQLDIRNIIIKKR